MQIEIEHYCKTIKGTTVLDDISLSMASGRCYGLQGKNGSGKTMLLRAIAGLIFPSSGFVSIDGSKVGSDIEFPESLGLLIETPSFPGRYTGLKNLQMLATLRGIADDEGICQALVAVGLDPGDKRPFRKYSLGMRQRLGIANAIMEKPSLLLLDEPINALDPTGVAAVEAIVESAKSRGAIVVVACHDSQELELLADEIVTMAEGRIVSQKQVPHD